jgi:superfamily II DNA helicase RecQ
MKQEIETSPRKKPKAKPAARKKKPTATGQADLEKALREWRLTEAKRITVPAFRILTDRALKALAESRPETAQELLAIPGIGLKTVEKYGARLFRILQSHSSA